MWNYPKSPVHQAAIDAMKPEIDREAARSRVAKAKLRREQEAVQALREREAERIAVLAKTKRLRAERLARELNAEKQPNIASKRGTRVSSKAS
jgi:hypothetical protein